jgi:hypothetical protein
MHFSVIQNMIESPRQPAPARWLAAADLSVGDVVVEGEARLEVIEDPITMHRGKGLFDEFELLVGVRVAPRGARPSLRIWSADAVIPVERPPDSYRP